MIAIFDQVDLNKHRHILLPLGIIHIVYSGWLIRKRTQMSRWVIYVSWQTQQSVLTSMHRYLSHWVWALNYDDSTLIIRQWILTSTKISRNLWLVFLKDKKRWLVNYWKLFIFLELKCLDMTQCYINILIWIFGLVSGLPWRDSGPQSSSHW